MEGLAYFLVAAALIVATVVWALVYRDCRGPVNCIGCGRCDRDGICILTGKPVGKPRL